MYCYFLLIVRVIQWGYINEYLKYNESTVNTRVCTGIVEVDICQTVLLTIIITHHITHHNTLANLKMIQVFKALFVPYTSNICSEMQCGVLQRLF